MQHRVRDTLTVKQLNIRVDFRKGKVVDIMPLPFDPLPESYRTTIETDTNSLVASHNIVSVSLGGNDYTYNYDSGTDGSPPSSTNIDWPVTMIFWNNAEVDAVKSLYWGTCGANTMHLKFQDDGSYEWDNDNGTKQTGCAVCKHMRLYADNDDEDGIPGPDDYNVNSPLGHYLLGTTHYDYLENTPDERFGWSESAAYWLTTMASGLGYQVNWNTVNLYNYEGSYWEGNRFWQSDGYATKVRIP